MNRFDAKANGTHKKIFPSEDDLRRVNSNKLLKAF